MCQRHARSASQCIALPRAGLTTRRRRCTVLPPQVRDCSAELDAKDTHSITYQKAPCATPPPSADDALPATSGEPGSPDRSSRLDQTGSGEGSGEGSGSDVALDDDDAAADSSWEAETNDFWTLGEPASSQQQPPPVGDFWIHPGRSEGL